MLDPGVHKELGAETGAAGLDTVSRPDSQQPVPSLKVVLLGDLGVGKTCLRSQFVHRVFLNAYKATIGADYLTTSVEVAGDGVGEGSRDPGHKFPAPITPTLVSLQVWDTAGQERFNLITQAFYRGADVAVLVYDVTNYESLLSLRDWFARFLQHCGVESPGVVIVGNKSDRASERAVDQDEVETLLCRNDGGLVGHVTDWSQDVFDLSCKSPSAVEAVFRRVALLGVQKGHKGQGDRATAGASTINLDEAQDVSSRCAC